MGWQPAERRRGPPAAGTTQLPCGCAPRQNASAGQPGALAGLPDFAGGLEGFRSTRHIGPCTTPPRDHVPAERRGRQYRQRQPGCPTVPGGVRCGGHSGCPRAAALGVCWHVDHPNAGVSQHALPGVRALTRGHASAVPAVRPWLKATRSTAPMPSMGCTCWWLTSHVMNACSRRTGSWKSQQSSRS